MPNPPPNPLAVSALPGVGEERAAQLARLGIQTVEELLLHRPRLYQDRRDLTTIGELKQGQVTAVRGRILALGVKYFARRTKSVFEFILEDGTARLHCRWWNLPYMRNYFQSGQEVLVHGKVKSLRPRTMDHPDTEVIEESEESSIHLSRIVPIYPLTEGLSQRWLRSLIWRALTEFGSNMIEPWPALERSGFPSRAEAIRMLHFPAESGDEELARKRLALDEFLALQWIIQSRRKKVLTSALSRPCAGDNSLIKPFLAGLGFRLTAAQTKVLREVRSDLDRGQPMRRLLQGDVGAGKTVVAACAALMALESGFNAVLMAPTEILAEQHFHTFHSWFDPLGIAVHLQTGARKTALETEEAPDRRATTSPARSSLVIGTHALIEEGFHIDQLGLVIIDEQHRFGVAQRDKLLRKGHYPHLLVMTATPIPRTLALTVYGDLDTSILDELPLGRKQVKTFVRTAESLPKVWSFIKKELGAGRQAYLVYPRVDAGEQGVKAVVKEFENVRDILAPFRVGLLHGGLKSAEKEAVMTAFRANEIQVLVATSVIEVGVDVRNATIMVIENAEQFGLAQLHQLRGRIGRGAQESFCILISTAPTPESSRRLAVLQRTNDGFLIAEEDLKLRGPGDLIGRDQSGLPPLRFGDLLEDRDLVEKARALAIQWLDSQSAPI